VCVCVCVCVCAFSLNAVMPREPCRKCSSDSYRLVTFGEYQGQREVVDLLPTLRLNHDVR
jgi:hypothetical protein